MPVARAPNLAFAMPTGSGNGSLKIKNSESRQPTGVEMLLTTLVRTCLGMTLARVTLTADDTAWQEASGSGCQGASKAHKVCQR